MKKTAITFSIIVVIMLVSASAMTSVAHAATVVPVTSQVIGAPTVIPGTTNVLPSGETQIRGWGYDLPSMLTIGSTPYLFWSVNTFDADGNSKTGTTDFRFDAIWYIGDGTHVSANGFSGNLEEKAYNYNPVTNTGSSAWLHGVLQGFGTFSGQTLKFDFTTTNPTFAPWSGYDIVR